MKEPTRWGLMSNQYRTQISPSAAFSEKNYLRPELHLHGSSLQIELRVAPTITGGNDHLNTISEANKRFIQSLTLIFNGSKWWLKAAYVSCIGRPELFYRHSRVTWPADMRNGGWLCWNETMPPHDATVFKWNVRVKWTANLVAIMSKNEWLTVKVSLFVCETWWVWFSVKRVMKVNGALCVRYLSH